MRHSLKRLNSAWASQIKPRFTPRRTGLDFINSLCMQCVFPRVCDPAVSCEKEESERQSRPIKEWLSSNLAVTEFRSDTCCQTPAAACWPSPRGTQGHYGMQITMKSLSYMINLRPGRWLDLAKGHGWWLRALKRCRFAAIAAQKKFGLGDKRGSEDVNMYFDLLYHEWMKSL